MLDFGADKRQSTLLVLFIPSTDRYGSSLGKKGTRSGWIHKALKVSRREQEQQRRPSPEVWACGATTRGVANWFGISPSCFNATPAKRLWSSRLALLRAFSASGDGHWGKLIREPSAS